ncbi:Inner membrane protein yjcH [Pantoea agglomerans]|uniref:Inner membrane protein yjcH n=1 Tax=Enterobacter agglomerans TaxID=549 RepID=A0A379ANN7_ENTAG|nr:Inner membrane protein yjcH [Pantoea agglomerans]
MNDALSNQDAINQQIERNPLFHELVRKRQAFATLLSLIMLVLYVGFILLIAFAPGWLGTPLHAGTNVTRGIPIGGRADCDVVCADWRLCLACQR